MNHTHGHKFVVLEDCLERKVKYERPLGYY